METIVAWTYVVGFSIPLLGSAFVLIRSIVILLGSGEGLGNGSSLIKVRPLPATLVILLIIFLISLALLLVVFFVFKFALPEYSLSMTLDVTGVLLFLFYISGLGSFFFYITGHSASFSTRNASLSGCLVEIVMKKVMGNASHGG